MDRKDYVTNLHALVMQAKTGDMQALCALCTAMRPAILDAVQNALKAHVEGAPFRDDLLGDSWELMARMVKRWKPEGGKNFPGYLRSWLKWEVIKHLRKTYLSLTEDGNNHNVLVMRESEISTRDQLNMADVACLMDYTDRLNSAEQFTVENGFARAELRAWLAWAVEEARLTTREREAILLYYDDDAEVGGYEQVAERMGRTGERGRKSVDNFVMNGMRKLRKWAREQADAGMGLV